MENFGIRDLREKIGDYAHDAGVISVISRNGTPLTVNIPFNEQLIELGAHTALAIKMYEEEILTLNKAARYAGVKTDEFIKMLGCTGLKAQKPIIGTGHWIILYSSYFAEHQVLDEIVQQRRYLIGTEVYLMIGITGIYT